jgi:hypothetical protein
VRTRGNETFFRLFVAVYFNFFSFFSLCFVVALSLSLSLSLFFSPQTMWRSSFEWLLKRALRFVVQRALGRVLKSEVRKLALSTH